MAISQDEKQSGALTPSREFSGSMTQKRRLKKILKAIKAHEKKGLGECAIDFRMSKPDARAIADYLVEIGYNVRLKIWYSPPNTVTFKVYWH